MVNQQPIINNQTTQQHFSTYKEQRPSTNDHRPTNQQEKQGEEQELQHRIGVDWGLRKPHIQPIHQNK